MAFAVDEPARLPLPPASRQDSVTTLVRASLALQTARSIPPRFAPGLSATHGGFTTRDPGISPDRTRTGRPPRTCRSYVMWTSISSWRRSSPGALAQLESLDHVPELLALAARARARRGQHQRSMESLGRIEGSRLGMEAVDRADLVSPVVRDAVGNDRVGHAPSAGMRCRSGRALQRLRSGGVAVHAELAVSGHRPCRELSRAPGLAAGQQHAGVALVSMREPGLGTDSLVQLDGASKWPSASIKRRMVVARRPRWRATAPVATSG